MKQQLASSKTVLVRTVRTGNQAAYLRSKTEIGLLLPLSPSSQQAAMFPQREYVKDDPNLVPKLTAHSVLGAKMEIHARRDCLSRIGMIPIWSVPLSMLGWIDHIGRMVDWSINGDLETHSKDSHCVMDDHKHSSQLPDGTWVCNFDAPCGLNHLEDFDQAGNVQDENKNHWRQCC